MMLDGASVSQCARRHGKSYNVCRIHVCRVYLLLSKDLRHHLRLDYN